MHADGADAMRELLDAAIPVPHYEVERALEGDLSGTDARDAALSLAAESIAPLGPSVLRSELVKLVSDRLNVPATLVESVIADPARHRRAAAAAETAAAERRQRERAAAERTAAAAPRREGDGPPVWEESPPVHEDPGPEEGLARPQRRRQGARPPRADRARLPLVLPRAARRGRAAPRRDPRGAAPRLPGPARTRVRLAVGVPDALRVARHTERLREVVAFYRDRLGLTEVGGFEDHDGYDGVFLAVPGTGAHLEFTSGGGHGAPTPHPESLLVLYMGDDAAVAEVLARSGAEPVPPANPYWAEHGVTIEDPDGFRVVLVAKRWSDPSSGEITSRSTLGRRLRRLFELAEDSLPQLDAYIESGRVLVATEGDRVVGHLQLTDTARPDEVEVKNMAVDASQQRRGVGRSLMEAAVALARDERRSTLAVATAAADIGNLRFSKARVRMRSIERDAFTSATG